MSTDEQQDRGQILLSIARASIAEALGRHYVLPDYDQPWLDEPGASFVTLTRNGALRGCIGSLEAHRPLRVDVASNALAAALRDPRFPPLTSREWPDIRVEVSLLSPPEPLPVASEQDAWEKLRPHVDGVILEYGPYRSTFLPQVWEQLPDPDRFLAHLKMKAGLPWDFWAPQLKLARYSVRKWKEPEQEIVTP
ncbi:AmmeMemoRadiSam system protein A [Thiobacter aerophilum]|uniref:AmmeMemoRadiSam system protein A n=1 Tax=Thiobacter aerophilum TaxID=3121275 RepID=A0ABV0EBJ1_9BURK